MRHWKWSATLWTHMLTSVVELFNIVYVATWSLKLSFLDMTRSQLLQVAVVVVLLTDTTIGYEIEGESDFESSFGKRRETHHSPI
jgi:hypothetical protein